MWRTPGAAACSTSTCRARARCARVRAGAARPALGPLLAAGWAAAGWAAAGLRRCRCPLPAHGSRSRPTHLALSPSPAPPHRRPAAEQVRKAPLRAVFVFIAPPSLEELEARLRGRGTESEEQIATRLRTAREEVESVQEAGLYDHVIVNDDFDAAYQQLAAVARRCLAGEVGGPESSGAAAAGGAAAAAAGAAAVTAGGAARSAPGSPSGASAPGSPSGDLRGTATFKTWLPPAGEQQQAGAQPAAAQQQVRAWRQGGCLVLAVLPGPPTPPLLACQSRTTHRSSPRWPPHHPLPRRMRRCPRPLRRPRRRQPAAGAGWSGTAARWRL